MGLREERTQWKQWAASITATITMINAGAVIGWATITLPRLLDADSPISITPDQSSWIVSLSSLGVGLGPLVGAFFGDTFGRKWALLLTGLVHTIGWIITLLASSVDHLYVARTILGLGNGIAYTVCPLYVSEIADLNIRGAMGTVTPLNFHVGIVLAGVIGPLVSTEELTLVLLLIPTLFLVCFVWFPETPSYLASKGRHEDAARSLAFFRGVEGELKIVDESIDRFTWRQKLIEMTLPNNRRAMAIIMYLVLAQFCSGGLATVAYLDIFFRKANIGLDSNLATCIVLVVGLVFCALGTLMIERIGRRQLMMISSLGSFGPVAVLGTYLLLSENGTDLEFMHWVPVAMVMLFQGAYQVGLGSMPDVMVGELFHSNVRGVASAMMSIGFAVVGFVVMKLFQVVGDALGQYVLFYCFAGSSLISFVYSLLALPETRNRAILEIQEDLAKRRSWCFGRGTPDPCPEADATR